MAKVFADEEPTPTPAAKPVEVLPEPLLVPTAIVAKPSTVKKSGIDLTKVNTFFIPPQLAKKKAPTSAV